MRSLLAGLPITLLSPADRGLHLNVAEDGNSYAENAAIKALAFMRASGVAALADDSGLEVDALEGRPGLYSHRFAPWPHATDADRRAYLLAQLHGIPGPWLAHFHCTVAIALPGGELYYANGDCYGEITSNERGSHGFGYDPVFYIPENQATMAELDDEVKNQISHRARAIQAAIPILKNLLA